MKNDIIKQFNLPSYIKGKSFAEASKAIENKFKNKTDKYSMETKDIFMKRLSEAQEYTKQMEAQEQEAIEQPMQNQQAMGGFDPASMMIQKGIEGVNMGIDGGMDAFGKTGIDTSGAAGYQQKEKVDWAGGMKDWISNPMGAFKLAGDIIGTGKANNDIKKANQNAALSQNNTMNNTYAGGGEMFNPVDPPTKLKIKNSKTGKVAMNDPNRIFINQVGDGTSNNTKQAYANEQYDLNRNKAFKDAFNTWREGKTGNTRNDSFTQTSPEYRAFWDNLKSDYGKNNPRPVVTEYAKGGYTNDFAPGGYPDFSNVFEYLRNNPQGNDEIDYSVNPDTGAKLNTPNKSIPMGDYSFGNTINKDTIYSDLDGKTHNKNNLSKADLSGLKRAGVEALRYAPAIGNALQLNNLEKPDYEKLNRLDARYKKDSRDSESTANAINANFNPDYAKEGSGGSLASYLSNRQGAELNKLKAIDQGYKADDQINRQENSKEQQFNLGVDRQNLSQANQENEINARNEGNYDTQKSKLIGQLGNDIGNIGKEQAFKQMVKDSGICYDTSGAYICGTDNRLTDEQVQSVKSNSNQNSKGGMLDSNSMFSSYLDYLKNK